MNVRLPVKVRHGDGSEVNGTTRDLCSSGIFLYTEGALEPGSKIELVITVPESLGLGPGGMALCQASVVRVEQGSEKGIGVAATLDRIELLPQI